MIHLYLALYSEGTTDDKFLSTIIERTVQDLVRTSAGEAVELHPLFLVRQHVAEASIGAEKILEAARIACEYDLLMVHRDADYCLSNVRHRSHIRIRSLDKIKL